jgi:hypothetical protein
MSQLSDINSTSQHLSISSSKTLPETHEVNAMASMSKRNMAAGTLRGQAATSKAKEVELKCIDPIPRSSC